MEVSVSYTNVVNCQHGLEPRRDCLATITLTDKKVPNEPVHEISNNVVCATSKASDHPAQSDQSLC